MDCFNREFFLRGCCAETQFKIKDECLHLTTPITKNEAQLTAHLLISYRQHMSHLRLDLQTIQQVTGKTLSFALAPKQESLAKQVLATAYTAQQFGPYNLAVCMVLDYLWWKDTLCNLWLTLIKESHCSPLEFQRKAAPYAAGFFFPPLKLTQTRGLLSCLWRMQAIAFPLCAMQSSQVQRQ